MRAYLIAFALLAACGDVRAASLLPDAPAPSAADEELSCLANAIYYEAGFEPREGREAVAEVVLNRLADARFPKTVCGVVYQGSRRATGCQFTFTCDGSLARPPASAVYAQALEVARSVLAANGPPQPRAPGANHYHADYVRPYWAKAMTQVARIGRHIFYVDGRSRATQPFAPSANPTPSKPEQPAFAPWGLTVAALGAGR